MVPEQEDAIKKTTVYIPASIWEGLRFMAIAQRDTANNIIVSLLKGFLESPQTLPGTFKNRCIGANDPAPDLGKQRTLRIPAETLKQVDTAIAGRTTLSNLIQFLVRRDLEQQIGYPVRLSGAQRLLALPTERKTRNVSASADSYWPIRWSRDQPAGWIVSDRSQFRPDSFDQGGKG